MIRTADAASEFRLAAGSPQPVAALVPAAMMAVFGFGTALAAVLSNDLGGAVANLWFGGVLMAAWVMPLRAPLLLVMFVGLSVDRPGDADDHWASPLITVGGLLFQNLNKTIGVEALKFSGVSLLLGCLLMVRVHRLLSGRVRDTSGSIQAAPPVFWGIVIGGFAMAFSILSGWLRGGDIQMAKIQVQGFLQLMAAAYLFGVSLRGPRDYRTAGKLIVAAACLKAIMAVWVRFSFPLGFPNQWGVMTELEYATNHGDSLVFACAIAVLIGPLVYRPRARQLGWTLITLPILIAGLVANDRRLAWVQVALVLIVIVGMNLQRILTRRVMRVGVWLSPVLAVYVVAGWMLPSRVFAPVNFVRGLVVETRTDGSLDRSTLYRDAENYNLVNTFRSNPLFGTGFGHPFTRVAYLDDISVGFREFAYLPHNSLLGLWAFTGVVGFTGIFAPLIIALFLAARAHAVATEPAHAVAATAAIGGIGAYVLHAWGDIGFTEPSAIFLVGLAVGVAGQVAADTGAWPLRWRRRGPSASASGQARS